MLGRRWNEVVPVGLLDLLHGVRAVLPVEDQAPRPVDHQHVVDGHPCELLISCLKAEVGLWKGNSSA